MNISNGLEVYCTTKTEVGKLDMAAASSIEQRWSQRRAVSLAVDIVEHGELLTSCKSKDVGLGGVFLQTQTDMLDRDKDVELLFSLGDAEVPVQHKLKAKVVRLSSDGAGFMFKDFDTSSFRALQEIIRYSSAVAAG